MTIKDIVKKIYVCVLNPLFKYFPVLYIYLKYHNIKNINSESYWDKIHTTDIQNKPSRFGKSAYKLISPNISFEGKNVLDVGAGIGDFLFSIDKPCRRFGIDISQVAVDYLRHNGVIAEQCSLPNITMKQYFDIITCFETLEHIRQWKKAIESMILRLKMGGYLIISIPQKNRVPDREHVNYFDISRIYKFLEKRINVLEIKLIGPRIVVISQKSSPNPTKKIPSYFSDSSFLGS